MEAGVVFKKQFIANAQPQRISNDKCLPMKLRIADLVAALVLLGAPSAHRPARGRQSYPIG